MINKQTLKVDETYHEKIVRINSARCSYVDGHYYQNTMGEDATNLSYKSYPVRVIALRMQWILKDPAGQRFLLSILRSENLDLYTIPAVQIIIEFLYIQYKRVILTYRLPVYLI